YQWNSTGGKILSDSFGSSIQAKFHQTGTLQLIINDLRSGCKDTSIVHPTFALPIQGNTIELDSQPCLAYLNGTTLTPGAGTTSYLWQYGKDTTTLNDIDTLEDINYFIPQDSLFFRRVATNANC